MGNREEEEKEVEEGGGSASCAEEASGIVEWRDLVAQWWGPPEDVSQINYHSSDLTATDANQANHSPELNARDDREAGASANAKPAGCLKMKES